jgi:putative transcriptional regulator
MESLQGHLLIASPELSDPDFVRTVILLIQHCEAQAVGVVLNRPTEVTVKDLCKSYLRKSCDCPGQVYSGGPVPGTVMAVHTCPDVQQIEILPGIYYAVTKKDLDRLVRQPGHALKIFDGHVGWGPGQLEPWLDEGAWSIRPASAEQVFASQGDLWEELGFGG